MESAYMILGQSAAAAASLAIVDDLAVQDVPYVKLRQRLEADGQVVDAGGNRAAQSAAKAE